MVYGEVMQRWRMASGVVLRKWPKEELERWGGWFLFGLFAAILVCGLALLAVWLCKYYLVGLGSAAAGAAGSR